MKKIILIVLIFSFLVHSFSDTNEKGLGFEKVYIEEVKEEIEEVRKPITKLEITMTVLFYVIVITSTSLFIKDLVEEGF